MNLNKIKNPRPYSFQCKRCGHEWSGFVAEPKICGNRKCRSYYWNHPAAVRCESGQFIDSHLRRAKRAAWRRDYDARPDVRERRRQNDRAKWKLIPAEKKKERNRRWLIRHYGLQPKEFDSLMAKQDSRCAICKREIRLENEDHNERPHIDHNHETNEVRGILCGRCNSGLGHFADNPERLRAAANYLEGK